MQAIRDGYGWLMENWRTLSNYYGMYSLEKVADLGHVHFFGNTIGIVSNRGICCDSSKGMVPGSPTVVPK